MSSYYNHDRLDNFGNVIHSDFDEIRIGSFDIVGESNPESLIIYNQNNPLFEIEENGNIGITGNTTMNGDLTVNGILLGTTSIITENLIIQDPLLEIAITNPSDLLNIGTFGTYNDGTQKYTGWIRNVTDGKMKFIDSITKPGINNNITELIDVELAGLVAVDITTSGDLIVNSSNEGVKIGEHEIKILNSGTTHYSLVNDDGNFLDIRNTSLGTGLGVAGTSLLAIKETGEIGIGTTNPISKLDVVGDINTTTNYNIGTTNILSRNELVIGDNVTSARIQFNDANPVGWEIKDDLSDFNRLKIERVGGNPALTFFNSTQIGIGNPGTPAMDINLSIVDGGIGFGVDSNDLQIFTNSLERIRVETNGNTGIGGAAPSNKLNVVGDVNVSTDFKVGNTTVLNGTTLGSGVVNSSLTSNTGNLINTGTLTNTGDITLNTVGDNNRAIRLFQDSQNIYGNVGIESSGTTGEAIMNWGINYSTDGGIRDNSYLGLFTRIDTRSGNNNFTWLSQTGASTFTTLSTLDSSGNLEVNGRIKAVDSVENSTGGDANVIAGDIPYGLYTRTTANQSIGSGVNVNVIFNEETLDRAGLSIDGSGNIAVPSSGLYLVQYSIHLAATNTTGVRNCWIEYTGSEYGRQADNNPSSTAGSYLSGSATINITGTLTLHLEVVHTAGALVDLVTGSFISLTRIGNSV